MKEHGPGLKCVRHRVGLDTHEPRENKHKSHQLAMAFVFLASIFQIEILSQVLQAQLNKGDRKRSQIKRK